MPCTDLKFKTQAWRSEPVISGGKGESLAHRPAFLVSSRLLRRRVSKARWAAAEEEQRLPSGLHTLALTDTQRAVGRVLGMMAPEAGDWSWKPAGLHDEFRTRLNHIAKPNLKNRS